MEFHLLLKLGHLFRGRAEIGGDVGDAVAVEIAKDEIANVIPDLVIQLLPLGGSAEGNRPLPIRRWQRYRPS